MMENNQFKQYSPLEVYTKTQERFRKWLSSRRWLDGQELYKDILNGKSKPWMGPDGSDDDLDDNAYRTFWSPLQINKEETVLPIYRK